MPPKDFKLTPLDTVARPAGLVVENPTVPDALAAFQAIEQTGDPFAAQDGNVFPPLRYTQTQAGGVNEARNHFQGVQRLREGPYLAVSGGDRTSRQSHLFVLRLGSRNASGPWGSNLIQRSQAGDEDRVIAAYKLESGRWHAGGLSRLGDVLAVPLEGESYSRVAFLHTANAERLTRFQQNLDRKGRPNASAAALTQLEGGRFVCAVSYEIKKILHLEFYVSADADFCNGFGDAPEPVTWRFPGFGGGDKRRPEYQNVNFVVQRDAAGDRRLFLVATENEAPDAPFGNGANVADLWEVQSLGPATFDDRKPETAPRLQHVTSRVLQGLADYCNFDAVGGTHIEPRGRLSLYGAYHWRFNQQLRLTEFSTLPGDATGPASAWVVLYEHPDYRGRRLALYGQRDANIADYRNIVVQGSGFNDVISSARWSLPAGVGYRLYREPNFAGDGAGGVEGQGFLTLTGRGEASNLAAATAFADTVSSSRFVTIPS